MSKASLSAPPQDRAARRLSAWLAGGWRTLHFGALLLAMALSPSTYSPENRRAVADRICLASNQLLPSFVLLAALFSLVVIHIVVVTAQSYGLSQYALGTVVRVLVVELLPLAAALFVALRAGISGHAEFVEFAAIRQGRARTVSPAAGTAAIAHAVLPRVVAGALAVVSLTAISGVLALLLTYLSIYGLTPWGIDSFTRTVGQIFDPVTVFSLGLKTLLFSLAVATVPATVVLDAPAAAPAAHDSAAAALQGTVRLFALLIAIEILSLTAEFF